LAHYLLHPGAETSAFLRLLRVELGHLAATWAPLLVVVVLASVIAFVSLRQIRGLRFDEGAHLVVILAPPDVDPYGASTLWMNLVALLRPGWRRLISGQPHLGFEITSSDAGLTMAVWVPGSVPVEFISRSIEAAWPGARTTTVVATPPLTGSGTSTGGQLRLSRPEHFPIKTDHKVDPLRPLLGALASFVEGESACLQILARPVTGRRLATLHKAAVARRAGLPTTRTARFMDLVTPGPTAKASEVDPSRSGEVADILEKSGQPCWAISVRYGVATSDVGPATKARLAGRAHAVASSFALFSGRNHFVRRRLANSAKVLAGRRFGKGDLVSVAELAALAHLPTDISVPGLSRAGARAVAPPPAVARFSSAAQSLELARTAHDEAETNEAATTAVPKTAATKAVIPIDRPKVLGDAQAGGRRAVSLSVADARFHLHVMGATGSGKSTLLTNLVLGDVEAGRGVVVIDPKGDLITDLCDRLPEGSEERTVLIDPQDPLAAPVLNVLDGADPDLVVDNLVGIFRSIFAAFWGPRTDDIFRSACLTLMRYAVATGTPTCLADVPRLLSDDKFRAPRVAAVVDDTVGLGGFWLSYEAMSESNRAQVIGPLMNKLRAFLLRDFVRSVVGRPGSSFEMGDVLDGGVCLVRVPKGILGEETAKLLGSFVVAQVWQTALHRARLGQSARVDATLVVDECQNFLNLPRSFDEMLAEARGYRLSMVLAHQHLGQLPRELREAVSANARSKVWFSMSPEDAHVLSRHVAPEVSEHDLTHLGAYTAATRLVVDGEETAAFTLCTRPVAAVQPGRAEAIRKANRALHARPEGDGTTTPLTDRAKPISHHTDHSQAGDTDPDHRDSDDTDSYEPHDAETREWELSAEADGATVVRGVVSGVASGVGPGNDPTERDEDPGQGHVGGSSRRADLGGDWS